MLPVLNTISAPSFRCDSKTTTFIFDFVVTLSLPTIFSLDAVHHSWNFIYTTSLDELESPHNPTDFVDDEAMMCLAHNLLNTSPPPHQPPTYSTVYQRSAPHFPDDSRSVEGASDLNGLVEEED